MTLQEARDKDMLPPVKGACKVCASKHKPFTPHNLQNLYYHFTFHAKFGRWPTWADACAHCTQRMINIWKEELIDMKMEWTEPPSWVPIQAMPVEIRE